MTPSDTERSRLARGERPPSAFAIEAAALVKEHGCLADAPPICVISPSSGVPTLPLSADDTGLLDHYFNENECDLSIHQLALRCKRPLAELTAWLNLPHIASLVEAFLNVRRITQVHRDMEKRERALNGLCAVLEFSTNLVETRRAACAVLRAVDNARPRARRTNRSGSDPAPSPAPSREMEPRSDCTPSLPRREGCHEASASRTRDWVGGEDSLPSPRLRTNSSGRNSASSSGRAPTSPSGKACPSLKSIIHKHDKPAVGSVIASESCGPSDRPRLPDTSHLDTSTPSCPTPAHLDTSHFSDPSGVAPSTPLTGGDAPVASGDLALPPAVNSQPSGLGERRACTHTAANTSSSSSAAQLSNPLRETPDSPLRTLRTDFAGSPSHLTPASLAAASGAATPRSRLAATSWP